MANQQGRNIPPLPKNTGGEEEIQRLPKPDEEIQSIPWPWGKRPQMPEGLPVREIKFSEGIAWNGPPQSDLPRIPKPIVQPRSIPSQVDLPEIQPVDADLNLNFIARLLASVFIQPRGFTTGQMTCGIANRGYQLPDILIPPMQQVVVKSWFTNVGVIYVACRQADSQSVAVAWPLVANEGVGYRIPNVSGIWVMATVAGEGVNYTVEQA